MTYQPEQARKTSPANATGSERILKYTAAVTTAEPAAIASNVRMLWYSLEEG